MYQITRATQTHMEPTLDLRKLLYPDDTFQRWLGVPDYLTVHTISVEGSTVIVKRIYNEKMQSANLLFYLRQPYLDYGHADVEEEGPERTLEDVLFLRLDRGTFIDAVPFQLEDSPAQWNVYIDGKLFLTRPFVMDDSVIGKFVIGDILTKGGVEWLGTSPLKEGSVLSIQWSLFGRVASDVPLIELTYSQMKAFRQQHSPKKEPGIVEQWGDVRPIYKFTDDQSGFVMYFEYDERTDIYDGFRISGTAFPSALFGVMKAFYGESGIFPGVPPKISGTFAQGTAWMPVEFANYIARITSRIVMDFHPALYTEGAPLVDFLKYESETGKALIRRTPSSPLEPVAKPSRFGGFASLTKLTWNVETYGPKLMQYLDLERRFQDLSSRHYVSLSVEERNDLQGLLEELEAFTKTIDKGIVRLDDLKCQLCSVFIASHQIQGDVPRPLHRLFVCEDCGANTGLFG